MHLQAHFIILQTHFIILQTHFATAPKIKKELSSQHTKSLNYGQTRDVRKKQRTANS
jgi:hypothetical protein